MTDLIVVPQTNEWHRLKALVLDSVSSPITRRVYNLGLASISTRSNSANTIGVLGDSATSQANWMISFLSPNQGIGVG